MPKHSDFGATEENTIKNGTAYGANRLEVIFMTDNEKKLIKPNTDLSRQKTATVKRNEQSETTDLL